MKYSLSVLLCLSLLAGCSKPAQQVQQPQTQEQHEAEKAVAEAEAKEAKARADEETRQKEVAKQKAETDQADQLLSEATSQKTSPIKTPQEIELPVDATSTLPNVAKVVKLVEKGQEVPYDLLTQAFIDLHVAKRVKSHWSRQQLNQFFDKAIPELVDLVDQPRAFQVKLEQLILKHAGLKEIQYEESRVNLLDVFNGLSQCSSGTALYTVAHRLALAKSKKKTPQHPVIILTDGHIFPGYFIRVDGEWLLNENETTRTGNAVPAPLKKADFPLPRRVVLENDFLLSEVVKALTPIDRQEKHKTVYLRRAAKAYELPLDEMEKLVAQIPTPGVFSPTSLASSVFGFGDSKVESGVIRRVYENTLRVEVAHSEYFYDEYKTVPNPKYSQATAYKSGYGGEFPTTQVPTGRKLSRTVEDCPPIFSLVSKGDYEGVKKLLEAGYDPNVTSKHFCRELTETRSPFHVAMKKSRLEIAELLLKHGFDPFSRPAERFSDTPTAIEVIEKGEYEYLALIAKYSKNRIDTALSLAGKANYKLVYTLLAFAVEKSDARAVTILLGAGASPEMKMKPDLNVRDFAKFLQRELGRNGDMVRLLGNAPQKIK
jgi:hypothetical protein